MVTVAPIAITIFLLLMFAVHAAYVIFIKKADFRYIIARYVNMIISVTYLVLPSVSTNIFGMFTCENIDPRNLLPGTPTYLKNDHSIACNSSRYTFGINWAYTMIVVYPFGIPCIYAYWLFLSRAGIKANKHHRRHALVDLKHTDLKYTPSAKESNDDAIDMSMSSSTRQYPQQPGQNNIIISSNINNEDNQLPAITTNYNNNNNNSNNSNSNNQIPGITLC